jgi:Uma2 family endonuclease
MAEVQQLQPLTVADYLAAEPESEVRHEYLDGQVVAMAGGPRAHSLLCSRCARLIGNHLAGTPCRVYQSGMKVHIPTARRFYYPDVMVCCGPLAEEPDEHYEMAPGLIVEVLSPTTAASDDGEKRVNYQTLASLQEYLLLDPDARRARLYRRTGQFWTRHTLGEGDTLELAGIGLRLPLAELLAGP